MAFFGTTPFPSTLPPTSPTLPPQCPIDLISKAKQQSLYKSRKDRLRTDGDPAAAAADDDAFEYLDPAALEALYQKQCQASTLGMVRFELDRCRLICDQVRGWPRGQAREVFLWRPGNDWVCGLAKSGWVAMRSHTILKSRFWTLCFIRHGPPTLSVTVLPPTSRYVSERRSSDRSPRPTRRISSEGGLRPRPPRLTLASPLLLVPAPRVSEMMAASTRRHQ